MARFARHLTEQLYGGGALRAPPPPTVLHVARKICSILHLAKIVKFLSISAYFAISEDYKLLNRLPSHPTKERRNAKITDFNVSLRGGPNHAQSQPRAIFFALGPP